MNTAFICMGIHLFMNPSGMILFVLTSGSRYAKNWRKDKRLILEHIAFDLRKYDKISFQYTEHKHFKMGHGNARTGKHEHYLVLYGDPAANCEFKWNDSHCIMYPLEAIMPKIEQIKHSWRKLPTLYYSTIQTHILHISGGDVEMD